MTSTQLRWWAYFIYCGHVYDVGPAQHKQLYVLLKEAREGLLSITKPNSKRSEKKNVFSEYHSNNT